jgi:hypothetical protein
LCENLYKSYKEYLATLNKYLLSNREFFKIEFIKNHKVYRVVTKLVFRILYKKTKIDEVYLEFCYKTISTKSFASNVIKC